MKVGYKRAETNSGPSPSIWGSCPVIDFTEDPAVGFGIHEDFIVFPFPTTNTVDAVVGASAGPWAYGLSSTSTITDGALIGGVMLISSVGDNLFATLHSNTSAFKIRSGSGRVWFEARVALDTIANTKGNLFVGLIEKIVASITLPLTTTGAMADKNYIGFVQLEAAGATITPQYKADGVTAVSNSVVVTAVAATFVKLGFYFDGTTITYFKDGTAIGTGVSNAHITATDGTDFPNDITMGLCIGTMGANATASVASCDWIRCYQERVA